MAALEDVLTVVIVGCWLLTAIRTVVGFLGYDETGANSFFVVSTFALPASVAWFGGERGVLMAVPIAVGVWLVVALLMTLLCGREESQIRRLQPEYDRLCSEGASPAIVIEEDGTVWLKPFSGMHPDWGYVDCSRIWSDGDGKIRTLQVHRKRRR